MHIDYVASTFRQWPKWIGSTTETRARNGYTRAARFEDVVIMWNPERPDMGYHLTVSGGKAGKWVQRLAEGRFTRVDVAFDLGPACPTVPDLFAEFEAGRLVAQGRKWQYIRSDEGNTLYIGSRQSESFCRCYDKRGFTRIEYEFKGKRAEAIGRLWVKGKASAVAGACLAVARWVQEGRSRAVRSEIAEWCQEWIGKAAIRLPVITVAPSIEKFVKWWSSLGAARVVADTMGADMPSKPLKERHYDLLAKYGESMGAGGMAAGVV